MRSCIFFLLLVMSQGISVQAQTTNDESFKSFREMQQMDYETLRSLGLLSYSILEKYTDSSQIRPFERSILQLNAESTLELVTIMRDRGRGMFHTVEQNYNRFCLQKIPGPLPCIE